jgi:hypothetical protein
MYGSTNFWNLAEAEELKLHGYGDLEMNWESQGRAGYMMQTLLSRGIRDINLSPDARFIEGEHVRVRCSIRSPLQGHIGKIVEINLGDARAPYLLQFHNGLQFRYPFAELQRIL